MSGQGEMETEKWRRLGACDKILENPKTSKIGGRVARKLVAYLLAVDKNGQLFQLRPPRMHHASCRRRRKPAEKKL
jgi:hypothetical protein